MKKHILISLLGCLVILSSYNTARAQCSAHITNSGKGCVGDTLNISVAVATKLQWLRGTDTLKTITAPPFKNYGITVAGQKDGSFGSDSTHLFAAVGVFVDAAGNVYVCDWFNNRVQKWAPGANYGVTVAGDKNGYPGSDSAHLRNPYNVIVDSAGNVYVADCHNSRVQKWAPGATYGVTVAGNKKCIAGTDSLHIYQPVGIYLDKYKNLYVSEGGNNRVTKWANGLNYGVTVAGHKNGAPGIDSTYLRHPYGLWLDAAGNIYISDLGNNRVQKWAPGAKYGVTVAGHKNGLGGNDSTHLSSPDGVYVDSTGNVYVADNSNSRIQKWAVGATYGVTVAGHKDGSVGSDSTGIHGADGVFIDNHNNLYIADYGNNRVQKWALYEGDTFSGTYNYTTDSAGMYTAVVTYNGGCRAISNTINISSPVAIVVNAAVCTGASYMFNGYGYTTAGSYTAYLHNSTGCDSTVTLNLTIKNTSTATINAAICTGSTYLFNGTSYSMPGTYLDTLTNSQGCDSITTLYLTVNTDTITNSGKGCVGDTLKVATTGYATRIQWVRGTDTLRSFVPGVYKHYGITVAGDKTGIAGVDSAHLNAAVGVCVDGAGNIYVSDWFNNRVQKWAPGATYGVTVAGDKNGVAGTDSMHLNSPYQLFLDSANNLYIADNFNHRVQKWAPGATYGVTVAGRKDCVSGSDSTHLLHPVGVYVDHHGTVYVAEDNNNRVTKWAPGAGYCTTVAGQKNCVPGTDSVHLNHPYGLCLDAAGNIYVSDLANNRVQKWAPGATYGITVAGHKNGYGSNDSTSLQGPDGIYVDAAGTMYIADAYNSRIQKWAAGATYGITVAGHKDGTTSSDSTGLMGADAVYVDAHNNLFTADYGNSRVQEWTLYTAGTNNYITDSAGVYTAVVTFNNGCKVTSHAIRINAGTASVINAAICAGGTYSFKGSTLSVSGTYADTLTNRTGCDSIVTLNLIVNSLSNTTLNASICAGSTYTFRGSTLSVGGTYYDTLTNHTGCDSIITLLLNTLSTSTLNIKDTLRLGDSITINNKVYKTAGIFTDTLIYRSTACDSAILAILITTSTGTQELSTKNGEFRIYPNPFNNYIHIDMPNNTAEAIITVNDILGQQVLTQTVKNVTSAQLDLSALNAGVYTIQVKTANGQWTSKVVKQN